MSSISYPWQNHDRDERRVGRIMRRGFVGGLVALVLLGPRLSGVAASHPRNTGGTPGTWALTGSLTEGRDPTTATVLADGRVLVAGGFGATGPISSAELYDPTTGTFTPTGSMSTPRYGHTATLLPNGQVLIAGGFSSAPLSSAALYDPTTGTFTPTPPMVYPHYLHTATLLADGRVLLAGSDTGGSAPSAELYDPASGTWTGTGSLTEGRYLHTATLLADGRVLVAGGYVLDPGFGASTEIYDPGSGTWSFSGSMNAARAEQTATLLPDGRVLITGGGDTIQNTILRTAELYDPTSGTWQDTGAMTSPRLFQTATPLANGQVLVAGGTSDGLSSLTSTELYDPATGTFTQTGSLSIARNGHSAVLLADGRTLVLGGGNQQNGFVLPAEVYTPPLGAQLAASPRRLSVGQTLALTGTAFAPTEPITLSLDCTCATPLTTTVAGAGGGFVTTLPLPPAVDGAHTLIAQGASSGRLASITVSVRPVVGLVPHVGAAGTSVTVSGAGFGASEAVAVHWNAAGGPLLGTARSSTQGSFGGASALHLTIPASRRGWHALVAVGQHSGAQATALFRVTAP